MREKLSLSGGHEWVRYSQHQFASLLFGFHSLFKKKPT